MFNHDTEFYMISFGISVVLAKFLYDLNCPHPRVVMRIQCFLFSFSSFGKQKIVVVGNGAGNNQKERVIISELLIRNNYYCIVMSICSACMLNTKTARPLLAIAFTCSLDGSLESWLDSSLYSLLDSLLDSSLDSSL